MNKKSFRGHSSAGRVVALSASYEREPLLRRGLGLEHLQELITRLARPIVRQRGWSIAFAGGWSVREDNFTHLLLRLISSEQEDNSIGGPDSSRKINPLLNHLAWPYYLQVTTRIEAEWINACRIVRIRQQDAGVTDICPDEESSLGSTRAQLSTAATLSAMRRLAMVGMSVETVPGVQSDVIPGIDARIIVGGKVTGFSGFVPGVFEEAVVSLEHKRPLYVLGGFGGAAEHLANAFVTGGQRVSDAFDQGWLERTTPELKRLNEISAKGAPASARSTEELLRSLMDYARRNSLSTMNMGLSDDEGRELLTTNDFGRAVQLVRHGLETRLPGTSLSR